MLQTEEKLPEWMLRLENKRKRPHRLAHEIGAGSPCLLCGEKCPGLDLHFWRKLCRNCKCKKEDHDVKDDEGYEQFEILLGGDKRKIKKGGYLNMKIPDDIPKIKVPTNTNKGLAFDWIPPNVSDDVAAEYMRQLPAGKLPISGSDGALYRRQQLEKQVPLHDLNADHCHNLTAEETQQLMKYLENLKTNVVGLGCVGKVPGLYSESRVPLTGPIQQQALTHALGRPLATSQSADSIRPLPPMPPAYNSVPRPFHASSSSSAYGSGEDEDVPPALPTSLPPRADLRTPSEFIDWRLPDEHSAVLEKATEGVKDLHLQSIGQSSVISSNFNQFSNDSQECVRQKPQFSGQLFPPQLPADANFVYSNSGSATAVSQDHKSEGKQQSQVLQNTPVQKAGFAMSSTLVPERGNAFLQAQSTRMQGSLFASGAPGDEASSVTSFGSDSHGLVDPILGKQSVLSFPREVVHSSEINQQGISRQMKPLHNAQSKRPDSLRHDSSDPVGAMVAGNTKSLSDSVPSGISLSEGSKLKSSSMTSPEMHYGIPGANRIDEPAPLRIDGVLTSSFLPHSVAQSDAVGTDSLPKSAQVFQQQHGTLLDPSYVVANTGSSGPLPAETPGGSVAHLNCEECGLKLMAGDVAVFAERAGNAAWHPSCFVCTTCKELLVDLMYFYHKSNVYCGRHFAELLGIPRCFACDELIFVKEYTMAEGKFFHVKHFCCYECDGPLGGKQYIPVEDQPVCLDCFERIYGKKCHTCLKKIAPGEQRVGWNSLNWHVEGHCFRCYECAKSLLGGRFVVKENQPFCSKECVQAGLLKLSGAS